MSRLSRLTRWFDDWMHPVAVRDMRRAVQNRFVFFGLIIIILGIVILSFFTVMDNMRHGGYFYGTGRDLFDVIYYSAGAIMIILIPLYLCMRVGDDICDRHNLVEISTLKPAGRTWGFFTVGFVMMFMVASITLPYMMFSYMLGGLDLPTVFLKWLAILILALPAIMGGIFVGTLTTVKQLRLILSLAYACGLTSLYIALVDEWLGRIRATNIHSEEWIVFPLISFFAFVWLLLLATARMASPLSNRVLPLRIFATISFVLLYAAGLIDMLVGSGHEMIGIGIWLIVSVFTLALMFLISLCEREEAGQRVQRAIPQKWWLRIPAWFLYTGSANGICWCVINAFLLVFLLDKAFVLYDKIRPRPTGFSIEIFTNDDVIRVFTYFILCGYAYGMTAIAGRRLFLKKRMSCEFTPIVLFVVFMFVFMASAMSLFISSPNGFDSLDHTNIYDHIWLTINPINLCFIHTANHDVEYFFQTGSKMFLVWSIVITLFLLPWFWRQIKDFKPLPESLPTDKNITA